MVRSWMYPARKSHSTVLHLKFIIFL
jgi:hypothetical protein